MEGFNQNEKPISAITSSANQSVSRFGGYDQVPKESLNKFSGIAP
jgi:hypothetical protein